MDNNIWHHMTVCKQMISGSFQNTVKNKLFAWKSPIYQYIRSAYDKFPDIFRMGSIIQSTYMKL